MWARPSPAAARPPLPAPAPPEEQRAPGHKLVDSMLATLCCVHYHQFHLCMTSKSCSAACRCEQVPKPSRETSISWDWTHICRLAHGRALCRDSLLRDSGI